VLTWLAPERRAGVEGRFVRIVIFGDLQYDNEDAEKDIMSAFREINALRPDVVSFLGDYGDGRHCGRIDNILRIAEMSKILEVGKICPILGNHDLQLETGSNQYSHGTIENAFMEAYHLDETNYVSEYDDFRLFFWGDEPEPEQIFYGIHDNYTSPESFRKLRNLLDKRPATPVIMFTHAQPLGAGLKYAECHCRASNVYLNQNANPEQWLDIIDRYPQIVLWFNGHYHLGQFYKNSMSSRYGIDFYLTGVLKCSRDDTQHTRVLDITKDNVCVSTYDHKAKDLVCNKNYNCSISRLKSLYGSAIKHPVDFDDVHGKILKMLPRAPDRVYLLTDTGYVWEVNLTFSAVMGTLNYSKHFIPVDIFMKDGLVWCTDGSVMRGFDPENRNRFMREYDEPAEYVEIAV
jgi:hypothetical protein